MSKCLETFRAAPAADVIAELGESPLWDVEIGLRWLDVEKRRMFTLGLDGRIAGLDLSATVMAVELALRRELLAVTSRGFSWLDPETGRIDQIHAVLSDHDVSMNDGAIDPHGRCWAGSAVRDGSKRGALHRLAKGSVTTEVRQIGMSNGIGWSPTGERMYHVDTAAGTITVWWYDVVTGKITRPRVLRTVPTEVGLPDGLTVDAAGGVWLALWGAGRIWRLDPRTGETTSVVDVPTPYTTSCEFGGPDLSALYITTANYSEPPGGGLLYVVDLPVRGQKPRRFGAAGR